MKKVMIGLLLCSLVITILSGCRVNISIGTNDTLTSETYPDAEKYQISSFTYNAAGIKAVEVYWRSGEVEITESDNSELHIKESGGELPEDICLDKCRCRVNGKVNSFRNFKAQMLIRCIHLNFCAGFAETDSQHTVIQKVVHGGTGDLAGQRLVDVLVSDLMETAA